MNIDNILEFNIIRENLAELTSCELSKELAFGLMPENDIEKVRRTLKETDDAVALIMKKGRPPLSGIANIIKSVKRAESGSMLSFSELLQAAGVLKAARRTLNYCGEDVEGNSVAELIHTLMEDYRLEADIYRCIISEDEMADEASSELADIRRKILREQQTIKDRLNEIIHSQAYSKSIQDGVITVRGDRYCIPVKAECKGDFPGMVHDMSGSGQTLFIEPAAVVEANNKIRELRGREKNEIERITMVLSSLVAESGGIIIADVKILSEIDFAFAKASLALKMKAKLPTINDKGIIKIIKGRHPLIDPHKVVPISLYIGEKFRTLVITGPNTGGKTVTLKTVGLFTIMMQSGLLVPCESTSELAVFDNIFADIGDEQSIAQSLSTFSAHMSNIVKILQKCDEKSLVLFDELGAGTDPTEGAALAMAILECVYQMGATTLATTHYSELKAFTVSQEGFENASCEFDVETLSPTYRLMIGIPGKSNAFAISSKLGLDPAVVDRAREFLTSEDVRFEDMLSDIDAKRREIEQKEDEIRALSEEAERLKSEITVEKEEISRKKDEIMKKARDEAAKIVANAKKEVGDTLSELRTLCRDAETSNKERIKAGEALGRGFSEFEQNIDADRAAATFGSDGGEEMEKCTRDNICIGKTVYSTSIDGPVTVLKAVDKNDQVYVQAGIMKVYLPLSELRIITEKKEASAKAKRVGAVSKGIRPTGIAATVKTEIDVRGMLGTEAIAVINRYLEDARSAHLDYVTIIHGKGTGALRTKVHDYLKRDKRVESFRNGEFGEGDFGVTIVKMK